MKAVVPFLLYRLLAGAVFVVAPTTAARGWLGDERDRLPPAVARCVGVRDVVLSTGALSSVAAGRPAARWLLAVAVAEAGDAAAAVWLAGRLPGRRRAVAVGGPAALALVAAILGSGERSRWHARFSQSS